MTSHASATVTLRVAARKRVRRQRTPAADAAPSPDRVPRVARMLALAHHWRGLIRSGAAKDQADLARLVGVTRARVTQVMDLLYLAPDIQEEILFLGAYESTGLAHRALLPLAGEPAWDEQRRSWHGVKHRPGDPCAVPLELRGR